MARIAATLPEIAELLAVLSIKLESATVEEMTALIDDAREAVRDLLSSCLASESSKHPTPEEGAVRRAELAELGEALQAQIVGIVEVRWAQLTGRSASSTRH
jgi:hypothetical protein